jgi:hypothetical protein
MGRMLTMVVIAVSLIFLFELTGISSPIRGIGTSLLNAATGEITVSTFFKDLFSTDSSNLGRLLTLVGLGVGAVAVSFFARTQGENIVILGFVTTVLMVLVGVFTGVMVWFGNPDNVVPELIWMANVIKILMGTFIVVYIITAVEFFRSNV